MSLTVEMVLLGVYDVCGIDLSSIRTSKWCKSNIWSAQIDELIRQEAWCHLFCTLSMKGLISLKVCQIHWQLLNSLCHFFIWIRLRGIMQSSAEHFCAQQRVVVVATA